MEFFKSHKRKIMFFLSVCSIFICVSYVFAVLSFPGEITLFEGEEYLYNFKSPILINIKADRDGIISLSSEDINDNGNFIRLSNPVKFKTIKNGIVNLSMSLFGLLPLKTMRVDVIQNRRIMACGNTIGVKLEIDGILVIGISDVETVDRKRVIPARDSGIRPGDSILSVNGKKINSINELIQLINESKGNPIKLGYRRGNDYYESEIQPVKAVDDDKYHIGLWVRETTAGIGTLTFYDPGTGFFGALGHGITDIDTGMLIPVKRGEILECSIIGIRKSTAGNPGELKGIFIEDKNKLGNVKLNSKFGIYGVLNKEMYEKVSYELYPIGLRSQVKEGPAVILANIDGNEIEEYSIEIQKVSKQSLNGSKGMIIKITDERLINKTGGIVQGMSGSPIIQDGKLIGAVTHVLVNDPTRGYGIFIEGMLRNISGNSQTELDAAG
ncbi:MAG TPA: SpoIVB peptidase [Clostridiaceae bacterium]|nr:SpoIVB peptidase [Clostridiaceae bacterium]